MAKNDKEIIKLYNKKINMMFVAKDLINFEDESKSRILVTIVKCKSKEDAEAEAEITTDFFITVPEFKTLFNLIMYNKLRKEWKRYKGSSGEARILTVKPEKRVEEIYYSFKIDAGKGLKRDNDSWQMVKQEKSLIYNLGHYETIEFLTAIDETITANRMHYIIKCTIAEKETMKTFMSKVENEINKIILYLKRIFERTNP